MSTHNSPKVSIVIPIYNGEKYLCQAIDSALAQTYENTEVIVVDDGSTDSSAALIAKYGDKIRFFQKPNGGVASALNLGITQMRGDYFSWLSHDDVYRPDKIQIQMDELQRLEDKNTVIYSSYDVINAKGDLVFPMDLAKFIPIEKRNVPLYALLRSLIHGCTLLIPAVYFRTIGYFDEALRHTQDYDFFFKLMRVAPIHFCNHSVVLSRLHPEQNSRQQEITAPRIKECDHLWSMFLSDLTDAEMMRMEKTPYLLLRRVGLHLSKTEYAGAADFAKRLADRRLTETKISVVMPFFDNLKMILLAIDAVLAQTHANLELILINDGAVINPDPILAKVAANPRLKYYVQPNAGYHAALAAGAHKATGRYIIYSDVNSPLPPDALETHLRCKEDDILQANPHC